jgi:hypothetical protein
VYKVANRAKTRPSIGEVKNRHRVHRLAGFIGGKSDMGTGNEKFGWTVSE